MPRCRSGFGQGNRNARYIAQVGQQVAAGICPLLNNLQLARQNVGLIGGVVAVVVEAANLLISLQLVQLINFGNAGTDRGCVGALMGNCKVIRLVRTGQQIARRGFGFR